MIEPIFQGDAQRQTGTNVLTIPEKYASHRSVEEHLTLKTPALPAHRLIAQNLGHAAYHRDQAPWLMNSPMAIWSVAGGACLALGVMHFLVWCGDRNLRASLWFTGVTMPVVFMAWLESSIVHASTTEMFCILHRWGHVSFFITFVCVIGFIRSYFGTTRSWILWPRLGVRAVILVLAFVPGPTFNFREVSSLVPYNFLGETLIAPVGVRSSWEFLGNISGIFLAIRDRWRYPPMAHRRTTRTPAGPNCFCRGPAFPALLCCERPPDSSPYSSSSLLHHAILSLHCCGDGNRTKSRPKKRGFYVTRVQGKRRKHEPRR